MGETCLSLVPTRGESLERATKAKKVKKETKKKRREREATKELKGNKV
jgi:hypothetical protein